MLTNGICAIVACYIDDPSINIKNVVFFSYLSIESIESNKCGDWFRKLAGTTEIQHAQTFYQNSIETKIICRNGLLDSHKQPAIVHGDYSSWWSEGRLHRANAPAVIDYRGYSSWWFHGVRHRTDGPAIITSAKEEWWCDGVLHRVGAPAVVTLTRQEWWSHGVRHRIGAPAIIDKAIIISLYGCMNWEGVEEWWCDGVRHRINGPAYVVENKLSEWWRNGHLHRNGAPAIIDHSWHGDRHWFSHGVLQKTLKANGSIILHKKRKLPLQSKIKQYKRHQRFVVEILKVNGTIIRETFK